MFDPDFDPLADLEKIKTEILMLRSNDVQLATAYNTQNEQLLTAMRQLEQISKIQNMLIQEIQVTKNRLDAWINLQRIENATNNKN